MDCKAAAPLLHLYLDGELDRETIGALERHVDDCPDCSSDLRALDDVRQTVRKRAARHPAPVPLRAALEAAAGASRRSRAAAPRPWIALAASVVVAAMVSAGTTWWTIGDRAAPVAPADLTTHDLVAGHLRALAAASPVDVVSTNHHTVKPWFAGRVASVPPVPDLSDRGFVLVGGRIDYVRQQRIAVVVYRRRGHLIDIYFLPPGLREDGSTATRRLGYSLIATDVHGQPAWIVSDLDERELSEFQRDLVSAR